jgi:hypothetical protein
MGQVGVTMTTEGDNEEGSDGSMTDVRSAVQ